MTVVLSPLGIVVDDYFNCIERRYRLRCIVWNKCMLNEAEMTFRVASLICETWGGNMPEPATFLLFWHTHTHAHTFLPFSLSPCGQCREEESKDGDEIRSRQMGEWRYKRAQSLRWKAVFCFFQRKRAELVVCVHQSIGADARVELLCMGTGDMWLCLVQL